MNSPRSFTCQSPIVRVVVGLLLGLSFATAVAGCETEVSTERSGTSDAEWLEDAETSECAPPLIECDDECIHLETDAAHCGGCDHQCADGEVCSDGNCVTTCPSGQEVCDDGCFDLETSIQHCGECDRSCDDGQVCSAGACETSCGGGLTDCDGVCRDTDSDRHHCGGCDNPCDDGEVCSDGDCTASCGDNLTECDGICRDTDSDPAHCGGCNSPCPPSFACVQGSCASLDTFPTTVPGLQLWLRADQQVETTGGDVTSWANALDDTQVATSNDADTRPTFISERLGGEPTVRFDGEGDLLTMDNFSYPQEEFTHVFAFVPMQDIDENTDGTIRLFAGDEEAGHVEPYISFNDQGTGRLAAHLFVDDVVDPIETTTDTWYAEHPYVVTVTYDDSEVRLYVDGELENTSPLSGTMEAQHGFELGAFDGDHHFDGDIAEMLIFDRALAGDEIEDLHHYKFARYNMYFDDALWPEQYSDEIQTEIQNYNLSEAEIESGRLQNVGPRTTCDAHHGAAWDVDGLYTIEPDDASAFVAYCDMETDGGWTLVGDYRSDAELFSFDHRRHQLQTDDGGTDVDDPPLLGLDQRHGHIAYTTFVPDDQTLRLQCRTGSDDDWYTETTDLFDGWEMEDKPSYGEETWGILGGDEHGRASHFVCGHQSSGAYTGIGLCSGPGESGEWYNHVVSFSFTNDPDNYGGGLAIGCDGSGLNEGKTGDWRGRLWTR